ncbi:uncharacterized protein LOC129179220 isoform X2 [Dunckerocampus dactyliophorus]|uniref:uncharacterized protein LOC129179220 isoform X2 n=1 Tax=Dunckerocampus dactyliophorus TaxID=161453 RepID=UPI002405CAA6|nr:uncharacterized protein LOC129179220 isoform X2 [Dunckerocampus dactyliophorus]
MASGEEEVCRTREEKERQQQPELCTAYIVLHAQDAQQLIGRQGERPRQPQGGISALKQKEPQPPHVKEEEKELWITQEGECLLGSEEADLTTLPTTGVSVKTEDHEDKPPESSQLHHSPHVQQLIDCQEEHSRQPEGGISTLKREHPQPPHVKEEEEELWTTPEGKCLHGPEEADLTKLLLTGVSVKTEDHEDKPPESSQLHHSPSEENRRAEPPSSSSPQHMTTEADGDQISDSEHTSRSSDDEDGDDTREASSSDTDGEGDMRTHADNKHSGCSKKKTAAEAIIHDLMEKACFGRRGGSTDRDRSRINRLIRRASSVLDGPLDCVEEVGERRMLAKLTSIMDNTSHPLHDTVVSLGSSFSSRLLHPRCKKERFRRSFIPTAVRLYNT